MNLPVSLARVPMNWPSGPVFLWADRWTARVIMEPTEMRRSLARIAHEILERNHGPDGVIAVGIHSRGVPIARRLAAKMGELEGNPSPRGSRRLAEPRRPAAASDPVGPADPHSRST